MGSSTKGIYLWDVRRGRKPVLNVSSESSLTCTEIDLMNDQVLLCI